MNNKPGNAGIRRSQRDESDPLSSPIEDPSNLDVLSPTPAERSKKAVTASGSTKLALEVKERVARHVALKRRDKVIPVGSNLDVEHAIHTKEQKNRGERGHTTLQVPPIAPLHVADLSRASESEKSLKKKPTHRGQVPPKMQGGKSTKKEKQVPVGPIEYAQQLLEKAGASTKHKNPAIKFLEGKTIFYIGGDMKFAGERTRGRMALVRHGILARSHRLNTI